MTTTPQQLPQLEVVEIDVASDESVRAAARTVEERVGKIDGMFCFCSSIDLSIYISIHAI